MNELEILESHAVDAAIRYEWPEAIKLNQEIIAKDKKNLNAFLRLGFAYLQSSQYKISRENYQKALKIQPGNQIAKQNLDRLKILEKGKRKNKKQYISLDPNLFIEIPGKTKSVVLVNLGQKDLIAQMTIGQELSLKQKKRRVEVRTKNQEYIGCLPDDLSKRLIFFLDAQSKYEAFIKEANLNKVTIFIKELKKGDKVARYISFPPTMSMLIPDVKKVVPNEDELEKTSHEEDLHEIEKMAEEINEEEKIYLPYGNQEEEEEEE